MLLLGMTSEAFAQNQKLRKLSMAEYTFNTRERLLNHHHYANLGNGNSMIIEMYSVEDYALIKNFGSLLTNLQNDITFYGDSLNNIGIGNVRIDYAMSDTSEQKKIRFMRYPSEGDIFFKDRKGVSALKLEQDTIRIRINVKGTPGCCRDMVDISQGTRISRDMQITLLLNSYKDIDNLIEGKDVLERIIDTLAKASKPSKPKNPLFYHTTIFYTNDENGKGNLVFYNGTIDNQFLPDYNKYYDRISFSGNIGAGLIRNTFAPLAEVGLEFRDYWTKGKREYSVSGLYISPYFLFSRNDAGKYRTQTSWFLNAEFGMYGENEIMDLPLKRFTIGAGYLLNSDNIYFQKTTFKVFSNLTLPKGITISPEVIFTNNLKNIFPGVTVKIF